MIDELVIAWSYLATDAYAYCSDRLWGERLNQYTAIQLIEYTHWHRNLFKKGTFIARVMGPSIVGPEDFCRYCGTHIFSGKLKERHYCLEKERVI